MQILDIYGLGVLDDGISHLSLCWCVWGTFYPCGPIHGSSLFSGLKSNYLLYSETNCFNCCQQKYKLYQDFRFSAWDITAYTDNMYFAIQLYSQVDLQVTQTKVKRAQRVNTENTLSTEHILILKCFKFIIYASIDSSRSERVLTSGAQLGPY